MPLDSTQTPVCIPAAFAPLAWQTQPDGSPLRYKVAPGGRGSAKTESFARVLALEAFHNKHLILCTRQFQNSIADSVHRVIQQQIYEMGLGLYFTVTEKTIHCPKTGSEFIYKGLERNINEIRSMFGITRCWIEEANNTRKSDFLILDPTIRETGAQIWISYNPEKEDDALHKKFVIDDPPPDAWVKHTTFRDNPWFPPDLERLRLYTLENDPDEYDWIWEGNLRRNADAMIFKNKIHLESIEEVPFKTRFYFGLDFGHSVSPTCLLRCWIKPNDSGYGEDLVIDREAYAYGIELDEMAQFFDNSIEDVRKWPIRADNARPETISYLSRQGFQCTPATKWQNSEIDGVEHLRAFRKIIIHPTRCPHVARDFRLYSYKTDPRTREVLPIIVDKDDHGPDSCIMEGQLVETDRGPMPIETIQAGDNVLTRGGYQRVLHAWCNGDRPIWRLRVGRKTLYATAKHRIALAKGGWTPLDAMRYTDDAIALEESAWVRADQSQSKLSLAWNTLAICITSTLTGLTTVAVGQARYLSPCTELYGSENAVLFQTVTTSTTSMKKTAIRQTSIASIAYQALTICQCMARRIGQRTTISISLISTLFDISQNHGMLAMRVGEFIGKSVPWRTRTSSQPISRANSAAGYSRLGNSDTRTSSAQMRASRLGGAILGSMMWTVSALSAALRSVSTSTRKPSVVPIRVKCAEDTGRTAKVYDLEVEGQPEFFANGILVHNCRYALDDMIQHRGGLNVWLRLTKPNR